MMIFLINVSGFLLFAVIGSLMMCGWYKSTRPKMIFGFWSEFWEQKTYGDRDIADHRNKLEKDLKKLHEVRQAANNSGNVFELKNVLSEIEDKEWELNILKPRYKFPEVLVHPISGCVFCFASIYGSLIYWIVGSAFMRLNNIILSWQSIILWIAYMLTTCALNGIIIKKVL
jgi:hypothetical protein